MTPKNSLAGILMMLAAMAGFASKDGLAKHLVSDLPPVQLIWLQFAFSFLVLIVLSFPKHRLRSFKAVPIHLQLGRGLAAVTGIGSFYWALSYIPLADASAIILIAPLVVTALAPFLLGEKSAAWRAMAVVVGFVGVLLILRPGFRGDSIGYLIALGSGTLYGLNYIANRKLGHLNPPLVNYAHSVLFGAVLLAPVMPFVWVPIPAGQWLHLLLFLVIALVATGLLVNAFRFGEASVIAPYQYTVIVFASVIGIIAFGTFPDWLTWVGIALIIGAGLYIALREHRAAKWAAADSKRPHVAEQAQATD